MKPLPAAFIREMQDLFHQFGRSDEWPAFLASFASRPDGGLRANSLKIGIGRLRQLLAAGLGLPVDQLAAVPWSADGLYIPATSQPGRLTWHSAGLYYIQEPSAMLPATVLAARPGEKILDLCAAPGGKSCRIAADLQGEGLLWANEISADRVRALLHNIELTGCQNCLITQETPERLARRLPEYFDRILVDAPCSGSGMFRRDPSAMDSWLAYGSGPCTILQQDILRSAWAMLRPGGSLVYSTCTFSIAENEAMILWLTGEYPDCQISPITKPPGVSDGLPLTAELAGTARIWPHLAAGDGHFCALLKKADRTAGQAPAASWPDAPRSKPGAAAGTVTAAAAAALSLAAATAWQVFDDFCRLNLSAAGQERLARLRQLGVPRFEHACLHVLPAGTQVQDNLKNVKTGLFLGQIKTLNGGRMIYEPSQAFLFSLGAADFQYTAWGRPDADLIRRYLRGETLNWPEPEPPAAGRYAAIILDGRPEDANVPAGAAGAADQTSEAGWPLGWAKTMPAGQLKNLYPQAWRRLT